MLKCPCGKSVYEGCDKHFPETKQAVRNLNLIDHPKLDMREKQQRQPGEEPAACPRCGSIMPRGCKCDQEQP